MKHRYFDVNRLVKYLPPYINYIVLYPAMDRLTLDKCYKMGLYQGFDNVVVSYLFSLEAPSPEHILCTPENNNEINQIPWLTDGASKIVLAWGGYGEHKNRGAEVVKLLDPDKLYILGKTKTGQPAHPLKIKYNQELIKYGS